MLVSDDFDVIDICVYVKENVSSLDNQGIRELAKRALEIAEDSYDYIEIACVISHMDAVNDKKRGREIFGIACDLAENGADLFEAAKNILAKEFLNDKIWGKQLLEKALEKELNEGFHSIDGFCDIACEVTDPEGLNDKQWAREIFEMLLSQSSVDNSYVIEIAQMISDDNILGDKGWALSLINEAANNIEFKDDYLQIAFCLAHNKKLNNKTEGRKWFERAVAQYDQFAKPDYFDIAVIVADEQVLSDKAWAIDLCVKSIDSIDDSEYLLDIACFVEKLNKKASIVIFEAAIDKAETSMDLLNIACNISISEKLNDKKWGAHIFDQVLLMDNSDDERKLIKECMDQYL